MSEPTSEVPTENTAENIESVESVESVVCPKCGKTVTSDAAEGLCAACLLMLAADGTNSAEAATPSIESIAAAFPQLEILELIGHGGMGSVFKARQTKLNRFVALKILSEQLSHHEHFADRFLREAQLLAKLNHPNIVAVHDFGNAYGFYYLTMEFVDGVNLRQAMREAKFTPPQTLSIVQKICEALQFAHEEGILHRDIKPENILLDTKGRVKIADFGIGLFKKTEMSGNSARLTQTGQVLGTPNYMAPEQIETPNAVDHRADIYSLGVVFYELLTGELPLGRFPLPSEKTPAASALDDVVIKALKKNREERQQSAEELKTEIKYAAMNNTPKQQANEPNAVRSKMSAGQIAAIIALAVLGTALVFIGGRFFAYHLLSGYRPDTIAIFSVGLFFLTAIVLIVTVGYVITKVASRQPSSTPFEQAALHHAHYCTHCGNNLSGSVTACPRCGFASRTKRNFCFHCGTATHPEQIMCVRCGASLQTNWAANLSFSKKDKLAAALFAILVGWFGIHKFYLGSWGWGILYIIFSWTSIPWILGIIEGIMFLVMDDMIFDVRYNQTPSSAFRW